MRLILVASLLGLVMTDCDAASVTIHPIQWQDNPDGVNVTILLNSWITYGDVNRIKRTWDEAVRKGKFIVGLELNSYGGDGQEGLDIAKWVHDRPIKVILSDYCQSACAFAALVALGQGKLLVRYHASIGVHQATMGKMNPLPDPGWTEAAAERVRRLGAPEEPLQAMLVTAPTQMKTYGRKKLIDMGATLLDESWVWFSIDDFKW